MPADEPAKFAGKILKRGAPTRLVAPPGVTLAGDNVMGLGEEPQTHATIYEVPGPNSKCRSKAAALCRPRRSTQQQDRRRQRRSNEVLPRIYSNLILICGLAFGILLLGFVAAATGADTPRKAAKL